MKPTATSGWLAGHVGVRTNKSFSFMKSQITPCAALVIDPHGRSSLYATL